MNFYFLEFLELKFLWNRSLNIILLILFLVLLSQIWHALYVNIYVAMCVLLVGKELSFIVSFVTFGNFTHRVVVEIVFKDFLMQICIQIILEWDIDWRYSYKWNPFHERGVLNKLEFDTLIPAIEI